MIDPVVVMVPKSKAFPFRDRKDLVGKRGVTNAGESYGSEFDGFMARNLTVAPSNGVDQAFKDLLTDEADYMIVGLYPGLANAAKTGVKNQIEPLKTPLLKADMFIAFSKKSPCLALIKAFGRKVSAMRTNGNIETIIRDATKMWDSAQK
jgi:polar amino acid transport system substrate-binding protein